MPSRLAGRLLYIADLTRRQAELEDGGKPMHAITYRLLARRLRSALAGQATLQLRAGFRELPTRLLPVLTETLETRHFDEHGSLYGPAAHSARAMATAQALLARLRAVSPPAP